MVQANHHKQERQKPHHRRSSSSRSSRSSSSQHHLAHQLLLALGLASMRKIQPPRPASEKKYNRPVPPRKKNKTPRPASRKKNDRPVPPRKKNKTPRPASKKINNRPVPPRISTPIFCQSRAPAEMKKVGQPSISPPSRPVEILAVHVKPCKIVYVCMYICMYVCMVITYYSRVWINRVRLPILLVVS